MVQHHPRPAVAAAPAAAPGHPAAGRARRPRAAVPDGPDPAGGHHRTATSTSPTRCSTSTGCGGRRRSTGRTGSSRRSAPRRASTTSTRASRRPARTSRTPPCRRRTTTPSSGVTKLTTETGAGPVGHRAGLRLRAVRPRVRGLAGRRVLRREALPALADGDLRRDGAPLPVRPDRVGPQDPRRRPGPPRQPRHRDQRGRRGGGRGRVDALRAGQRAQPRAAAPDDHRRGGAAAVRQGRRDART